MRRAFAPEVDGHRVGVLPALLLCLHLVHQVGALWSWLRPQCTIAPNSPLLLTYTPRPPPAARHPPRSRTHRRSHSTLCSHSITPIPQPVTSVRTEDFAFAVNGSGASRGKARRMVGQLDYAHLQGSGAAGKAVDARGEAGVEAVSRADDVLSTVSVHTASSKVSYLSALFRLDAHERPSKLGKQDWPSISKWARGSPFVDAQLGAIARAIGAGGDGAGTDAGQAAPGRMFVSMFKAAPHWILRNGWMARWVLDKSQAVVQDETGLRPHFFNASASATARDGWTTSTLGRFTQFENRETRWYPGARAPGHATPTRATAPPW